ncbi:MAG: hypothetical protein JWO39_2566 [Gemmatimonadetes bacterium]|nr:hypothetical protein [Gemmatimonadota bacterium]
MRATSRSIWPALIAGLVVSTGCVRIDRASTTESQKQGITAMTDSIASDLRANGPNAWLRYFEQSPGFFMASDGSMAFPSNDSATKAVRTIAVVLKHADLKWGALRIDSLSPGMAQLAVPFDESLVDSAGNETKISGYFTGLAQRGEAGWKLRNAHWSIVHPATAAKAAR